MKIIIAVAVLLCLGVASAERKFPLRSLAARSVAGENQAYWYLGAPRRGSNSIQAIQVSANDFADSDEDDEDSSEHQGVYSIVQDDEDDENSYDDDNNEENEDGDNDSNLSGNVIEIIQLKGGNAMLSHQKENSGSVMVNNGSADLEDQDDDEESEENAIYIPREALENIPSGSIIALVKDESEGRANRYYYRRRRGGQPQRKRRGNGRRRRRGGNRRRGRPNIRVIRGGSGNRRPNNRRRNQRRGPNIIRL